MTSQYPHLANAPIVEALIDLRVLLPEGFNVRQLKEVHGQVEAEYPKIETQHLMQGKFRFTGEELVAAGQDKTIRGFRILGDEGRNIAQFRRDGFTFSRLKPYQSWETLYNESLRLWRLYRDVAKPRGINRLATRFINRIHCPPEFELGEYFASPPQVPDGMPDVVTSFLQRYVLYPTEGVNANVTLATESSSGAQKQGSVILDIDCYASEDVAPDDDERIETIFLKLWGMKNRIFFSNLTPQAIKAFE